MVNGENMKKYIIYFSARGGGKSPPAWGRGTCIFNDCDLCPSEKCTVYHDGERRIVVDEKNALFFVGNKKIEIIRIFEKE